MSFERRGEMEFVYVIKTDKEWGEQNPYTFARKLRKSGASVRVDSNLLRTAEAEILIVPAHGQNQDVHWLHTKQEPKWTDRPITLTVNTRNPSTEASVIQTMRLLENYILSKKYIALLPPGGNYPQTLDKVEMLEQQRKKIAQAFGPIADQLKPTFPRRKRNKKRRTMPLNRDNCMSNPLTERNTT